MIVAAAYQGGVWEMMWEAGLMVKLVLLILLFASVISWAIIIYKVNKLTVNEATNLMR